MLLVPASHRTVYYSYSLFGASRFSDEHVAAHQKAPRAMLGASGEGYCFDTNGIHRGTLDGTRARYSIVVEFMMSFLSRNFARRVCLARRLASKYPARDEVYDCTKLTGAPRREANGTWRMFACSHSSPSMK